MRRDMAQTVKQKWAKNAGNKNRPIQSKGEVTIQRKGIAGYQASNKA